MATLLSDSAPSLETHCFLFSLASPPESLSSNRTRRLRSSSPAATFSALAFQISATSTLGSSIVFDLGEMKIGGEVFGSRSTTERCFGGWLPSAFI